MVLTIIGLIVVLIIIYWIITYNKLVSFRTHADESWHQIDVQLQRRNDLIPNLVSTVKGYKDYEQKTLTAVVAARSALISANGREETMKAANQLTDTIKSLFAVSEAYPELHASTQF